MLLCYSNHRPLFQKSLLTILMVSWYFFLPLTGYDAATPLSATVPASLDATVPSGFPLGSAAVPAGSPAGFLLPHVLYIFSHANLWHLLGNLFVLWLLSRPLYLLPSILIAVLCSFLPAWGIWPLGLTVGFSGVIFAVWGVKWGIYCRRAPFRHIAYAEFCIKALPFALLGIFIPHVNWCIHLYCLLVAFLCGRFLYRK